ncbi:MAG: hypothetical protein MJZ66_05415 [Bacteroidales bacterium]|nr:hypothetical protein [Bacteroidales bacterium]
MKRFFTLGKTIMLATVLFAGLSLTSCGDDDDDDVQVDNNTTQTPDDKDKDKDKEPEQQPENKDPEKEPEKQPEADPSQMEGEVMLQVDYTTTEWSNWSGFAEGLSGDGDENGLVVTVTAEDEASHRQENGDPMPWFNQYLVLDHFDATKVLPGKTYRIYVDMEAEAAGTIRGSFGSWNHSCGFPDIAFEAGRKTYMVEFKDSESAIGPNDDGGDIHLQFLSGDFIGSYKIYNVAVTKM